MIFKVTIGQKEEKQNNLRTVLDDLSFLESQKVIVAPDKDANSTPKQPKKKKEPKQKKKKKQEEKIELLSSSIPEGMEELDPDIAKMMTLLDVDELLNKDYDEENENVSDPIISAQRGSYKKRKKDSNEYKKEFAEELTILYDLLGTTKGFGEKLKQYINLDGKQVGSMGKTLTDLIGNYVQAQSTQLQIIKEINSVKKSTIDLTIKSEARKDKDTAGQDDSQMISSIINGIMKTGRTDFTSAVRGSVGFLPQDGDDSEDYVGGYGNSPMDGSFGVPDDQEYIMDEIQNRLQNEGYLDQSSEMDAYLKYEKSGIRVCVKQQVSSGEWEFIAVDKDDIQVYDYPLPNRRLVEPMTFTGNIAVDRSGVQYKIIEV